MPKLRLSDADRERLGCPEFLPFETGSLTNREVIELARQGYKTPRMFWAALRAQEVREKGRVVDIILDAVAWTAFVWLALKRAGVQTDLSTLEFDFNGLEYHKDEEPEAPVEEGKAPDPDPSTSSETTS